jgi:hypothetical protein
MFPTYEAAIFSAVCAVQALAIASVVLARITEGCVGQVCFQRVYVALLLVLGGLTLATVFSGSGYWMSFGATLAMMALGGTIDLGRAGRATI